MTMRQSDSEDKLHFRTDRITIENGFYYFTTREGTQEGPFKTVHRGIPGKAALIFRKK
jgi:hypothetical protein